MSLPYENATSGNRAIEDIQKMLRSFGCTKFGAGEDFETGDLFVQFEESEHPRKKWQERVRNRLIQSGRITSRP